MAEHGIQKAKRRASTWRTTKPDPDTSRALIWSSGTSPSQAPNRGPGAARCCSRSCSMSSAHRGDGRRRRTSRAVAQPRHRRAVRRLWGSASGRSRQDIPGRFSMPTRVRRSAVDVDRPELVVSASCQASSGRMRRRRNVIPSPGACSDRRPMCATPVTARMVVITCPLFPYSQSPALRSVSRHVVRLGAPLEGADLVVARAVEAGPLQKESQMLSSDFLRGLRIRLVRAMAFLARYAWRLENFTPSI